MHTRNDQPVGDADEATLANGEARARRALAKMDLRLRKTPARSYLRWYGAGYQIQCRYRNQIVEGVYQRQYAMTISDVEAFIARRASR